MQKRVYLDHSATTPVRAEVAQLVLHYMTEDFGNPSSVHSYGRAAKAALEKARERIAGTVNARVEEIFFTSGGTESDNLAIIGAAYQYAEKGRHLITSSVEHHAVLDAFSFLAKQGFETTILPVDQYGMIDPDELKSALRKDTILISLMHANNEVGTIQPVEEIGALARERGIILHVDAVQSFGKIPVDVEKIKADLLSASGHKIYGPKGTGFLYVRKGIRIRPLMYGGGQEGNLRVGTENLAGIAGLGLAAELAVREMATIMPRLAGLRDRLLGGLLNRIPNIRINGHPEKNVPINANVSFLDLEGEALLLALDLQGIAASSGSACAAGAVNPSHVLLAMGISEKIAQSSVRMTLGRDNTQEDIDYCLQVIPGVVERLRGNQPVYK